MFTRPFLIAAAICAAASFGAYYELALHDPGAEAAKARAIYEATARSDAEEALKRCLETSSSDDDCKQTYGETLQSARSWYGKQGSAYNVTHDTQARNFYLVVAVIAGLVAFFQLRLGTTGSGSIDSTSRTGVKASARAEQMNEGATGSNAAADLVIPKSSPSPGDVPANSYRVVMTGRILGDADATSTRHAFVGLTGQSDAAAVRLLSGAPNIIKRDLSQAKAGRIVEALRGIGVDAYADSPDVPSPEGTSFQIDTDVATQPIRALYRAALGPDNTDFYLSYFTQRDAGGALVSLNWPAAFFPMLWALYRKSWFAAFLAMMFTMIAPYVIAYAAYTMLVKGGAADGIAVMVAIFVALTVTCAVPAMYANALYHRKIRTLLARAARLPPGTGRLPWLQKNGGVSPVLGWVVGIISLLFWTIMIAGVGVPAYQEYVQRAKRADERAADPPPLTRTEPVLSESEPKPYAPNDRVYTGPSTPTGVDPAAINSRMVRALNEGDAETAEQLATILLDTHPNYRVSALNALGIVAVTRQNLPAAEARFKDALRSAPENPVLKQNLGATYEAMGQLDSALRLTREAHAQAPDNAGIRTQLERLQAASRRQSSQAAWEEHRRRNELPDCLALSMSDVAQCLKDQKVLREKLGM